MTFHLGADLSVQFFLCDSHRDSSIQFMSRISQYVVNCGTGPLACLSLFPVAELDKVSKGLRNEVGLFLFYLVTKMN